MFPILTELFEFWTWKMAWRDCRAKKWKLLLFSSSIIFGIAALVTIGSLRHNVKDAMMGESKSLLGADLMLASRRAFTPETQQWAEKIGGEQAQEVAFSTMVSLKGESLPKLVAVRGIEKGFPFYGEVETTPEARWNVVHERPGVLIEESLRYSLGAEIGDELSFSDVSLPILGILEESPPSASRFSSILPTVIVSLPELKKTALFTGKSFFLMKSLSFHRTYFKLPNGVDPDALLKENRTLMAEQRLTSMTAKKRSRMIERSIDSLYSFLNIISFSALFLGGIGVAGALHVHIKDRLKSVATLRCIGCSTSQAVAVYLAQGIAMGLAGTLLGLGMGSVLVLVTGEVLKQYEDFLPVVIEASVIGSELGKACVIGFSISLGFSLLPLLSVRKVSPLAALRSDVSESQPEKDPMRWFIYGLLAALAFVLAWFDSGDLADGWKIALAYTFFIGLAFVALVFTGKLLTKGLSSIILSRFPFTLRQGASALTRPNNQTSLFMVSIGLGVFFIFTLSLMQNILLQWLDPARLENKPNIFIVDLPHENAEEVRQLVDEEGVKFLTLAPIVQLRIDSINGKSITELLDKSEDEDFPSWMLNRDLRCSYRSELSDAEEVVKGVWTGRIEEASKLDRIPVSMDTEIAKELGVKVGDPLVVEMKGFDDVIELEVTSLRKVDWQSMGLNFLLLFPEGVVEKYTSFSAIEANSPDAETTSQLQQKVYQQWPHVNTVDISMILKTIQSILSTMGTIIQIMALFTVCTGAVVLISTIQSGLKAKTKDATLLRTLGATKGQIAQILAVEYACLALIATLAGAILASFACALLAVYIFSEDPYVFPWSSLLLASIIVIMATVSLGMLLSRKVARRPPLAIIREAV